MEDQLFHRSPALCGVDCEPRWARVRPSQRLRKASIVVGKPSITHGWSTGVRLRTMTFYDTLCEVRDLADNDCPTTAELTRAIELFKMQAAEDYFFTRV